MRIYSTAHIEPLREPLRVEMEIAAETALAAARHHEREYGYLPDTIDGRGVTGLCATCGEIVWHGTVAQWVGDNVWHWSCHPSRTKNEKRNAKRSERKP